MDQSPSYRGKNPIAWVLMIKYLYEKRFSGQCPCLTVIKQQGRTFYQKIINAVLIKGKEENFQGGNIFSNVFLFKVTNRIMTVLTIRKYNAFQMFPLLIIRSLEIAWIFKT